jgi:hypothetical protein
MFRKTSLPVAALILALFGTRPSCAQPGGHLDLLTGLPGFEKLRAALPSFLEVLSRASLAQRRAEIDRCQYLQ